MSALKEYEKKLSNSFSYGRPLIHIETCDYEWECKTLDRVLVSGSFVKGNSERQYFSWSPYLGLRNKLTNKPINTIVGDTTAVRLLESLDNFISLDGANILLLTDIAYYFDSQEVGKEFLSQLTSRLYSFYIQNEGKSLAQRSFIIIVSPQFNIPVELQGYLYRLTPPYPDEEDIAHELGLNVVWEGEETEMKLKKGIVVGIESPSTQGIFYRYSKSFFRASSSGKYSQVGFEENKKKLLSAFKGMRIKSIQALLSYNAVPFEIQGGDNSDYLLENKKRMVRDSGLLKLENVPENYSSFVGDIDGLKDYVQEVKTIIDNRANYNENMSMPKGILLVGPPGCGKSETSKAIADVLNVPLLSLDMGSLMSKWHGEQEHNFQNAIALAEAAQPCVLRIDELEKAFSGTGNDSNNDQSGVRVLGFFLTWMQERTSITGSKSLVYLVATANNLEALRPEFLRKGRWDEIFYLIYPTAEGMSKIIQSCLKKYDLSIVSSNEEMTTEEELGFINLMTTDFFRHYPKCKISGAEIADAIERVYKKRFTADPSKEVKFVNIHEIREVLESFARKNRNYEIERKVREEIRNMQIEHQKHYRPLTKHQVETLRDIIQKKYSASNIDILIKQEIANLRISHDMSESKKYFDEDEIKKSLKKYKYNDDCIRKMMEDDFIDITMSFHVNNEPDIDEYTVKMLEEKLREKFEDIQDYEEYYESKGYKSASKPR